MLRVPVLRAQITAERLWSWPLIWATALTRPAVATYVELLAQPQATSQTACAWLLAGGASSGVLLAGATALGKLDQPVDSGLLVAIPIYVLCALLSWMLFAGSIQWLARQVHGHGSYPELLYIFATFSAPLSIITTLLSLLPNHGLATLCLYGYWFLLSIVAVQAVHGISWQRAMGVLLLALGVLLLLALCLLVGLGYFLL